MEQVLVENNEPILFINKFEKSSFEKRIDLLEDTSWKLNKDITNYLASKIEDFNLTSNEWYNVIIIELFEELGIFNEHTISKFSKILNQSNHYLIKLTVLDTFQSIGKGKCNIADLKQACLKLIRSKKDRLIVRVQAILITKYFRWSNEELDNLLISYVVRSNDYRLHLRLFEFLLDVRIDLFDEIILNRLVQISKEKDLGKALEKKLYEIEQKLKNE